MSSLPPFSLVDAAPLPWTQTVSGRGSPDVVVVASRPAAAGEPGVTVGPQARELAVHLAVDLDARLARAKASGSAAEVVELQVDPGAVGENGVERLLVVGLGDGSVRDHRRAGAALARRTRGARSVVVGATLRSDAPRLRAFVEGWSLAAYAFTRKADPKPPTVRSVQLVVDGITDARSSALARGLSTARAVHLARDLANTPSSEKSPAWLARQAERATSDGRIRATVRDRARLEAEGFGGLLAVGSGSSRPPCLIELRYTPRGADASTPHVVLVGKGITFDTGGLSLKPSDGMVAMKTDMSGGAAVIAVMSALAELAVPLKVTGLVAAAENMPSGSAYRPGDVIRQYGGTTVEVFNTDAEGRLVLADALAYAERRLDADVIVDVATLTGAATLGLGRRHAAMYATDDRIAAALDRAAEAGGERVWRMPLTEDYRDALDSEVADLSHISRDKHIGGGSITAALFLREFAGDRAVGPSWTSRDPARADGDEHEITRGATGWGTRTLLRWLESPGTRPQAVASRLIGDEQAVADREQHRLSTRSSSRTAWTRPDAARSVSGSRCDGSATRSCHRRIVEGHDAAGAQQAQRLVVVGGVLGLLAVDRSTRS